MHGVIFDLDQTLIDSQCAEAHRKARDWPQVYGLIPSFQVYDGIAEILELLATANVPVAVVTSSPRPYCEKVLKHCRFKVKHSVCYHDTSRRKPYPDPILKGVELLGCDRRGVVAIGDDPKDILSAKSAGVEAIAVTWGLHDPAPLLAVVTSEIVCPTVGDLHANLLERLK